MNLVHLHEKVKMYIMQMGDVADAMLASVNNLSTLGTTFELGGPRVYTLKQVLENIASSLKFKLNTITLPRFLAL